MPGHTSRNNAAQCCPTADDGQPCPVLPAPSHLEKTQAAPLSAPARDPKSRMLARHRQLPSSRPPRLSMYSRSLASCSASTDCCGAMAGGQESRMGAGRGDGAAVAGGQTAGSWRRCGGPRGSGRGAAACLAGSTGQSIRQADAASSGGSWRERQRRGRRRRSPPSPSCPASAPRRATEAQRPRRQKSRGRGACGVGREGRGWAAAGSARRGRRRRAGAAGHATAPPCVLPSCLNPCRGYAAALGGSQAATAAGGCGDGGAACLWRAAPGAGRVLFTPASPSDASAAASRPSEASQATRGACCHRLLPASCGPSGQSQAARDDWSILQS